MFDEFRLNASNVIRKTLHFIFTPMRWWWNELPWFMKIILFPAPLLSIAPFVAIEQGFLYWQTQRLIRDDRIYIEYIASLKKPIVAENYLNECKIIRVSIVYKLHVCLLNRRYYFEREAKVLEIATREMAGYLSLIPENYGDRWAWGKTLIFEIDTNGSIRKDLRRI